MNPFLVPTFFFSFGVASGLVAGDPATAFLWGMPTAVSALAAINRNRLDRIARDDAETAADV